MKYVVSAPPRPHRHVVESPFGPDLALFHLDTRRLHVLNGSAAEIWRRLPGAASMGDLAAGIADDYGISPVEVRADVERTVEQLRADGLLETDTRSGTARTVPSRPSGTPAALSPGSGCFAALDARIALDCTDEEIAAAITGALGPLRCDATPDTAITITSTDDDTWTLTVDSAPPVTLGSRLSVVLRALAEVNALAVASVPSDLVLHAGAVAAGGHGIVLPGGSNHGKSTLTTALVAAGFSYLTDEAAAITGEGHIRPFAKSIALDPGSFPLFPELAPPADLVGLARAFAGREWHVDPKRVGPVSGPVPLVAVVCPHWRAGASTRISAVEPVEALHLLLGDAFDFRLGGQSVFRRLVRLVSSVPVVRLSYSDTGEAVAAVRTVFAGATRG